MRFPFALIIVVCAAAAIGWGVSTQVAGGSHHTRRASSPPSASRTVAPHTAAPQSVSLHRPLLSPGSSLTAVAPSAQLTVYRTQAGGSPRTLHPTVSGAPLTLLVKWLGPRWAEVYLPTRPNGSTAWIPLRSVKLLLTRWLLTVRLRSHRLIVAHSGKVVRTLPVGVGRSVSPTPSGTYFITELLKQPDPTGEYGPYAFGLSAHSGVYKHFGRGGDGQIGIHGTNQPSLIGGEVSHGCIRLRNSDIIWLTRRIPLGTPVLISHS